MNIKFYTLISMVCVLGGCGSDEYTHTKEVIVISPPPPTYPTPKITALVLNKRILSQNREEYLVRLANGREVLFTVDMPQNYQVGDTIVLPY